MGFLSVLSYGQQIVKERVQPGDRVIDATMGTGVDTLFLARLVGPRGEVAAFDIQAEALELTRQRLRSALGADGSARASLHLASHAEMRGALPPSWHGATAAVMFNLGYLPTVEADKRIMTAPSTTLAALDAALTLLRPGGVLSVVLYPGHEGGDREADAVRAWAEALPAALGQAVVYRMLQRPEAPYVIGVEKRSTRAGLPNQR
ncbi:class I SAM-dependent methyltransferase [Paenibacillus apiarius]|uniref:Methyltransferase domain-containing protein n=1 Tax=Paenibacillus apiarius TaxID=46240 RepID=A0ABT4DUK3_9BACL|nr:class I SAM-dependent methyltransferase [Paenibacillus apiarius]MCY9512522.1 methyltransferase domain-containing protein [Paenibacillus apiarius]MCY9519793.1 methyltransferase domain-containing protein [Paenibacillus apiarius]MCY9553110.1 methyltransferase domain-containing protein [Paenibacillus apiarius]MCY9559322.1 methyltransferase domain-containing protein [Paenibacillus apiarius]MCY9682681.1 methyltransferase domain-containing protein [Paenibacillus apiarius]